MEQGELQAILDSDERHWWYRGRLRIVTGEVERIVLASNARILDAGCGSGSILGHLSAFGEVTGVDISPLAVAASRARRTGVVVQGSIDHLPFPDDEFDLVTCLDVLEHTPDDVAVLRELRRVTRPGGHVLLTVPAYPALWSRHDEINHHFRRYRRGGLREAATRAGLRLERDTHFNALLLPPAAAVRVLGRFKRGSRSPGERSELTLTPRALDPLLELPLRVEAALVRRGVALPLGLSVLATYSRPDEVEPSAPEQQRPLAGVSQITSGSSTRS
jgi:SAM-dependent methyltransferase